MSWKSIQYSSIVLCLQKKYIDRKREGAVLVDAVHGCELWTSNKSSSTLCLAHCTIAWDLTRYGLPDLPVQPLRLCDNSTQCVATQTFLYCRYKLCTQIYWSRNQQRKSAWNLTRYGLPDLPVQPLRLCENSTQCVATQTFLYCRYKLCTQIYWSRNQQRKSLHFKLFAHYLKSHFKLLIWQIGGKWCWH